MATNDSKLRDKAGLTQTESILLDSKLGERLKRGEKISGEELPLDIRRNLGVDRRQFVNFKPEVLEQLGYGTVGPKRKFVPLADNTNLEPIQSLADIVNNVASKKTKALQPQVMEQSTPMGSPWQDIINQIMRAVQPAANQALDIASLGVRPALQPIPTEQLASGQLSLLQKLLNPEAKARSKQQFMETIKKIFSVPQTPTLETELLKRLSTQYPELSQDTSRKGLKAYQGTGEIKLGGATYKIDDAGRIVKVR